MIPLMQQGVEYQIGAKVTYKDINLRSYRGIITFVGSVRHGGDCRVKWLSEAWETDECLDNLLLVAK